MKNLTPILLILIAVGLYFFYIDPMYNEEISQKEKVKEQYIEAVETTKQLALVLGRHVDTYNSFTDEDLERLDQVVPESIDPLRLIVDVNAVARGQGLKLENITVGATSSGQEEQGPSNNPGGAAFTEGGAAGEFAPVDFDTAIVDPTLDITTLSFSVSATYEEFLDLLAAFERSLRIFDIVSVEIGGSEGGSDGGEEQVIIESEDVLDFSVELQTYSLKQSE